MGGTWRAVLAAGVAVALAGCTQAWMYQDLPGSPTPTATTQSHSPRPSDTPTPTPTPTRDPVREQNPYQGSLADESCVPAPRDLLDDLEWVGGLGEAVGFQRGALVKADGPWWVVAVATLVRPNDQGLTRNDVDPVLWFVTNSPTLTPGDPVSTWPLVPDADDDAADRALICSARVPKPPPEPPENSPASYTGRLARGAGCVAVAPAMLDHLENVGRVGGAITYPRGQMVQANKKWWTVAVATQVHPNNLGHTRENVPEVVFFVTNAPSQVTPVVNFVLDEPTPGDTAAAAAEHCLATG